MVTRTSPRPPYFPKAQLYLCPDGIYGREGHLWLDIEAYGIPDLPHCVSGALFSACQIGQTTILRISICIDLRCKVFIWVEFTIRKDRLVAPILMKFIIMLFEVAVSGRVNMDCCRLLVSSQREKQFTRRIYRDRH